MSHTEPVEPYLSAKQASEILGVSVTTLYAYVSRGLLHSEPTSSSSRSRRYRRDEVERLAVRREHRRDPSQVARGTLDFGVPVLESAITLISGDSFFYRGHDAVQLARSRTLEEVAQLIWLGDWPRGPSSLFEQGDADLPQVFVAGDWEPIERLQFLLPLVARGDSGGLDPRPRAVAGCAARLLRQMTATVSEFEETAGLDVAEILSQAWCCSREDARAESFIRLFNATLILAADHELNVSSFTARCVASAGTTLYEVVTAGLAALRGTRHGALSDRTESWLLGLWVETDGSPEHIDRVLVRRLKQGEVLPGFGHRLYPGGDPRARALEGLLAEGFPDSPRGAWTRRVAEKVHQVLGEHPTLDFALAAVSLTLRLPPGSALGLFALGRTVGWIGHAIEQVETGQLIRPRARYTGPDVS